jgi:CheY-like chemotaxis protein
MEGKKVLIVDDVQSMRLVVKYTLEEMGCKDVDQAINGQLALEMLKHKQYDLVISDMEMPIMTGMELLQQLRATDKHKSVPFIMLTSSADKEKIQKAISQKINGYVLKPVNPEILENRILQALKPIQEKTSQPQQK